MAGTSRIDHYNFLSPNRLFFAFFRTVRTQSHNCHRYKYLSKGKAKVGGLEKRFPAIYFKLPAGECFKRIPSRGEGDTLFQEGWPRRLDISEDFLPWTAPTQLPADSERAIRTAKLGRSIPLGLSSAWLFFPFRLVHIVRKNLKM